LGDGRAGRESSVSFEIPFIDYLAESSSDSALKLNDLCCRINAPGGALVVGNVLKLRRRARKQRKTGTAASFWVSTVSATATFPRSVWRGIDPHQLARYGKSLDWTAIAALQGTPTCSTPFVGILI
jgi:hypothetical protein